MTSPKTLTVWIPGSVVSNTTTAPVKRPISAAHAAWRVPAMAHMQQLRQQLEGQLPLATASVRITFVGYHEGNIGSLLQTVLNLLTHRDAKSRPILKSGATQFENFQQFEMCYEPASLEGTGLRIELTL